MNKVGEKGEMEREREKGRKGGEPGCPWSEKRKRQVPVAFHPKFH